MGNGDGLSGEGERARRREYKKRWRDRNREKWRAARRAQKARARARRGVSERLPRGRLATMTPRERSAHNRKKRLKKEYGLTVEQYHAMERAQGGVCAICGQRDPSGQLVVDHCHTSGRVRGLLCNPCNRGLGFMRDNPRSLLRAVEYLGARDFGPWGIDGCGPNVC